MDEKNKKSSDKEIENLNKEIKKNEENLKKIDEADEAWKKIRDSFESVFANLNVCWKGEQAVKFQNTNIESIQNVYNSAKKKNNDLKDKLIENNKRLMEKKQLLEKEKNNK